MVVGQWKRRRVEKQWLVPGFPAFGDAVKDGETGLLANPNDPKDLSQTMMRLIEDRELRQRLGEAGRKWATNFSPEITATMMEEFYLKCLKG